MTAKIWPGPMPASVEKHWGRFFLTNIGDPLTTAPDPLGPIDYDPRYLPVKCDPGEGIPAPWIRAWPPM